MIVNRVKTLLKQFLEHKGEIRVVNLQFLLVLQCHEIALVDGKMPKDGSKFKYGLRFMVICEQDVDERLSLVVFSLNLDAHFLLGLFPVVR